MSEEQEDILNNIISSSDKNHIVFGDSGTGKTLLFVKLAFEINNIHPNDKIAMITSSNLIGDIKRIIKNLDLKNKIDIFTSGQFIKRNEKYDYVVVDEAHKLHRYYKKGQPSGYDYLDDNHNDLDFLMDLSDKLILLYDTDQRIRPINIPYDDVKKYIKDYNFTTFKLTKEFRISPDDVNGTDIVNGIKYALGIGTVNKNDFDSNAFKSNYFKIVNSASELFKNIRSDNFDNEYVNNRVVAGYARKWVSNKSSKDNRGVEYKDRPYDWIFNVDDGEPITKRWNYRSEQWLNYENSQEEIGSIHAVQGYDLNCVGVIVGRDLTVENGEYVADPYNYFDVVGKPLRDEKGDIDIDELTDYILNVYYVLLTRAINKLYVYFEDKKVEKLFKERLGI